jgi:hypothetical protein
MLTLNKIAFTPKTSLKLMSIALKVTGCALIDAHMTCLVACVAGFELSSC